MTKWGCHVDYPHSIIPSTFKFHGHLAQLSTKYLYSDRYNILHMTPQRYIDEASAKICIEVGWEIERNVTKVLYI